MDAFRTEMTTQLASDWWMTLLSSCMQIPNEWFKKKSKPCFQTVWIHVLFPPGKTSSDLYYTCAQPCPLQQTVCRPECRIYLPSSLPSHPPKTNTHTYREFSKYFSCIADVGSCLIKSCLDNSFCYFYQTLRKAHHASLTAQWDRGRGDGAYRVNPSAQQ